MMTYNGCVYYITVIFKNFTIKFWIVYLGDGLYRSKSVHAIFFQYSSLNLNQSNLVIIMITNEIQQKKKEIWVLYNQNTDIYTLVPISYIRWIYTLKQN